MDNLDGESSDDDFFEPTNTPHSAHKDIEAFLHVLLNFDCHSHQRHSQLKDDNLSLTTRTHDTLNAFAASVCSLGHKILIQQWKIAHDDLNMHEISELFAVASRKSVWQVYFGDFAILDFFLSALASIPPAQNEAWKLNATKLIANCCIKQRPDRGNQVKILASPPFELLVKDYLLNGQVSVALHAIYNICHAYPALQAMAQADYALLEHICISTQSNKINPDDMGVLGAILTFALEEAAPSSLAAEEIQTLLQIPKSNPDSIFEDKEVIIIALASYLQKTGSRADWVFAALLCPTMDLIALTSPHGTILNDNDSTASDLGLSSDTLATSRQALAKFLVLQSQIVGDRALDHSDIRRLVEWLVMSDSILQICACIVLGNLVSTHSELIPESFLLEHIPAKLSSVLSQSSDSQVLTASLDLLGNLAAVPQRRTVLGNCGVLTNLVALLNTDNRGVLVRQKVAYHVRQLLHASQANILLLIGTPEMEARSSAASQLGQAFERCSDEVFRIEIGRIVAEVLRTCFQQQQSTNSTETDPQRGDELQHTLARLFQTLPEIPLMLISLTQSENTSLRTEGWFALALAAGTQAGAESIGGFLEDSVVQTALQRVLVHPDTRSGEWNNARLLVDRLTKSESLNEASLAMIEGFVAL